MADRLNYDEKRYIQQYETLVAQRAAGTYVSDYALEQARQIADNQRRNCSARERWQAQLAQEEAAKQAARQAERDAAAQQAQDAYMTRRRMEFRGTAAQWAAMRDRILEDYLLSGGDTSDTPTRSAREFSL